MMQLFILKSPNHCTKACVELARLEFDKTFLIGSKILSLNPVVFRGNGEKLENSVP